jgi:hypothetical protein
MAQLKYKEAARQKAKRGKPALGKKPIKATVKNLYVKESRSIRDIAFILGCSKVMAYRSLKEFGIQPRKHTEKRSKLEDFNYSFLKKEIKLKGYNRVSHELGAHNTTLRRYVEKE